MAALFSADDLYAVASLDGIYTEKNIPANLQHTWQHLHHLNEQIYAQMRLHNMDLHPYYPKNNIIQTISVTQARAGGVLCAGYLRTRAQMIAVERLMGREEIAAIDTVEPHRHPVIELRLSKEGLTLELVLSRDAWWDQQNLMGKISLPRHRQDFYILLRTFERSFRMGFWQGAHLSEMHLSAPYFYHTSIMNEWLSTFQPGADWFRIGIWYPLDHEILQEESITGEIMRQLRPLYEFYEFIRWTSDNNYRDFYGGAQAGK